MFQAHRRLYHSTLGFRVIKKKRRDGVGFGGPLPSEYGTHKTVKARFWPWRAGEGPQTLNVLMQGRGLQGNLAHAKLPPPLGPL